MADFNRPGVTLDRPVERRPRGAFGGLGDRVAQAVSRLTETRRTQEQHGQFDDTAAVEAVLPWNAPPARFPITRNGYDCRAVDIYIAELEHELLTLDREMAQLNARRPSRNEIAAEIEQVGEQTSAILIAAHEQAQETLRLAQEQADRCIADAASNAAALTSDATQQVRELEREYDSLRREREGLLEDIRSTATALNSLSDAAAERFPGTLQNEAPPTDASTPLEQATIDE
jgi:cell division septum initiation protein DivIVA